VRMKSRPERGNGCASKGAGCILSIALLVLLSYLGVLTPLSDWLWHWQEVTTAWVRSPDGQWSAQLRTRGFLDGAQHRLYLRHRDQRAQLVCYPSGNCYDELKWSPDSRRVAGARIYDFKGEYREPWTIWVYDTVSKHEGDGWGRDLAVADNRTQELVDEKRETELFGKPDSYNEFRWKWRNSKEIVGYVLVDADMDSATPHPLFVYSLDDTPSALLVTWRRVTLFRETLFPKRPNNQAYGIQGEMRTEPAH
jgi:hypothetical protein